MMINKLTNLFLKNFIWLVFFTSALLNTTASTYNIPNRVISEECPIDAALNIIDEIEKGTISDSSLISFLESIDSTCYRMNVEYTEIYNSTFLQILRLDSERMMYALFVSNVQMNVVSEIIENPINDAIDLKAILRQVQAVDINEPFKKQILSSINKAIKKQ